LKNYCENFFPQYEGEVKELAIGLLKVNEERNKDNNMTMDALNFFGGDH